jgi:hypothetical protein
VAEGVVDGLAVVEVDQDFEGSLPVKEHPGRA